ncbi:hypothetical protein F4778DRAFT_84989 [Xylariomycetidae sp. FL2044]|nr:hypothetical protein F4778DRAFT_84989 [Xylariomycetidae sp. FL2044]
MCCRYLTSLLWVGATALWYPSLAFTRAIHSSVLLPLLTIVLQNPLPPSSFSNHLLHLRLPITSLSSVLSPPSFLLSSGFFPLMGVFTCSLSHCPHCKRCSMQRCEERTPGNTRTASPNPPHIENIESLSTIDQITRRQ